MPRKQPTTAIEEERRLHDLREHPLQPVYNDGLSEQAFRAFAEDVKRNGLWEKIHILPANEAGLPANTVLDGHKRRQALLVNGETTTTVIVRYDLAQADALTVEKEFLEFNTHRERRDLLLQARTALRLYEIEKKKPVSTQLIDGVREARDRVGKAIGMSGRNLNRYFRVLKTPLEVQNAFRAGKLSLVVAEKVADVADREREIIARRIRAGEDPRAVVAEYLSRPDSRHERAWKVLDRLARNLWRGRQGLDGRLDELRPDHVRPYLNTLRQAQALIGELIVRAQG